MMRWRALLCLLLGTSVGFAWNASAQPFAEFEVPAEYALNAEGLAVVHADYDGDGDIDLAIVTADSSLTIAWNDGAGVFSVQPTELVVPVDASEEHPYATDARTGDFDGNGFDDILIYTSPYYGPDWYQGCVVTLLSNSGDGSFAVASTLSAEPNTEQTNISSCNGLEIGDYNADGALDFVLTYTSLPIETFDGLFGAFNVFLGNGNGTFAQPSVNLLYAPWSPWTSYAVASGDFNGDGVTDLVFGEDTIWLSGARDHRVEVWSGDGTGGFASTFTAPIPEYATTFTDAAVHDYTGDGLADILLVKSSSISGGFDPRELPVVLLANLGDGSFAPPVEITRGLELVSLHTDDFNGDGLSDLVTLSRRGELATHAGSIAGLAPEARRKSVGQVRSSAAADFNGDGITDVALVALDERVLRTVFSGVLGPIAPQLVRLPTNGDQARIDVADFNRDGLPDLITSHYSEVRVLLGNEYGGYTPGAVIGGGSPPMPLLVADLNADENLDVVLPNDAGGFTTVFGTPDGTFGGSSVVSDGREYWQATLGDRDGDGDLDLAAFELTVDDAAVELFENDGAGSFSLAERIPVTTIVGALRFLDANADGAPDLFIGSSTGSLSGNDGVLEPGDSWVLLGDGSGEFGAIRTWPVAASAFDFADVNQDGIPDVATSQSIALGDGTGSFGELTVVDPASQSLRFADFDADGLPDLVTQQGGTVGVLAGNGDGTFGSLTKLLALNPPGSSVSVADFNADRLPDVYVLRQLYEPSSGSSVELIITLNATTLVPPEPEPPSCPSKPRHGFGWWGKPSHRPFGGFWGSPPWRTNPSAAHHKWSKQRPTPRRGHR